MPARSTVLSEREQVRAALIPFHQHQSEWSHRKIARFVGCKHRKVKYWFDRFDKNGYNIGDMSRPGRPRKLKPPAKREVHDILALKDGSTIRDAHKRVADQVSLSTVYREAKRDPDLSWGVEQRAAISDANIEARRAATTEAEIEKAIAALPVSVFLDEKIVRVSQKWGVRASRQRKAWNSKTKVRKQQLGGWRNRRFYAAIFKDANGVVHRHRLIIAPDGKALKAPKVIQTVLEPVHRWALALLPPGAVPEYILDGASIHTALISQGWMDKVNFIRRPHPA